MDTILPTHTHGISTSVEERALKLLGSGLGPEIVASALGVSPSRIAQLLSTEDFALQVAQLRYEALQKHNEIDNKYDGMEDRLLGMLDNLIPLMTRPLEILRAIQVINAAKRRGASAPEQIHSQSQIVELTIPVQIVNKFTVDTNNRVIGVEGQELITIQSGALLRTLNQKTLAGNQNVKQSIQQQSLLEQTVGEKTAARG